MAGYELSLEDREAIRAIAARHGAFNVRVFGSVARGEARVDSDVDLLMDMERGRTLIDLMGLWDDLEALLGRSVDVVLDGSISPYMKDNILSEAQPL